MKLFIGICNSQQSVPSPFFWSMMGVMSGLPVPVMVYRSDHPWDVVRNNRLIRWFLDSDCTHMVKMDIDQAYPVGYLSTMLPLLERYPVIGPLIFDRWKENDYCPLAFENKRRLVPMDLSHRSGIVEIPYPHTNLFYAREVLEAVPPPWYEAYLSPDGLARANHVDYDFLDKIRDAGYKIHINLDVVVGHLSLVPVGWR